MALPVSFDADLSAAFGLAYHGPFKSSGGNFYTVLLNTTAAGGTDNISLHKATDPTSSFAEQDTEVISSDADPIASLWCAQDGDTVHISVQLDGTTERSVFYTSASLSGDTLAAEVTVETITTDDDGPGANACSIAVDGQATPDIVVAYQGDPEMVMGTEYARIVSNRSQNSGSSWDGPVSIDNGGNVDWTGPVIVPGSSNRMHIFFKDDTNGDGYQRRLGSDDSLETFPSAFDATINIEAAFPFGHGIGGTTVRCPYDNSDNDPYEVSFTSADTPSPSTTQISNTDVEVTSFEANLSLSNDGTDLHLMFSGGGSTGTDRDVYRAEDTGSGWPGASAATEVLDAVSVIHISTNVYDRSGTKLAYIYVESNVVRYNEVELSAVTPSGAGTQTLGNITESGVGAQPFTGAADQDLPSITQAGVGAQPFTGDGTQDLPSVTQVGQGEQTQSGTADQDLPSITQSGAATKSDSGSGDQDLPSVTQSGAVEQTQIGNSDQDLPSITQAGVGAQPFTATSAQDLPSITQVGQGEKAGTASGAGAQNLPSITQSAQGEQTQEGSADQDLPSITQAANAEQTQSGTADQDLPSISQSGVGDMEPDGSGTQTLPSITQSGQGERADFVPTGGGYPFPERRRRRT